MAVITISREPGAFGEEIAARLAGKLGFMLVDKARLMEFWSEVDPDAVSFKNADEWIPLDDLDIDSETEATVRLLPELIVQLAEEHDLVVIGRGAQGLFRNCPGTLHVKIVASRNSGFEIFKPAKRCHPGKPGGGQEILKINAPDAYDFFTTSIGQTRIYMTCPFK